MSSTDLAVPAPSGLIPGSLLRRIMRLVAPAAQPREQDGWEPRPAASTTPLDAAEAAEWVDRMTPDLRRRIADAA